MICDPREKQDQGSQHPPAGWYPVPGNLMLSSGLCEHHAHMVTDMHVGKTPIYMPKIKISKILSKQQQEEVVGKCQIISGRSL